MIRTIIFDLGKVIVPFDLKRGYEALRPHCPYPAEEIPRRISSTDLVTRFESGEVSPEEFVERLSRLLGLCVDYDRFCELWSSIFLPHTLLPEPFLAALHSRYRLLLLSNTNAIHFAMIRERYSLLGHFDDYILSYKVGAMKPSERIYKEAIGRAQCPAAECFFTDDIPLYVEGARAAGMDAVVFESAGQIERELKARGVEW